MRPLPTDPIPPPRAPPHAPAGVRPRLLRSTRLAELVTSMDPKLVSAAFGMRPEGVLIYLADHVDTGRLQPNP